MRIQLSNNKKEVQYKKNNIIEIDESSKNQQIKSDYFILFPGQTKEFNIPINCKYRGSYNVVA